MAVVISGELALSETPATPALAYPRILYDDIWRAGTITASSEEDGFAAVNIADGFTWDFWRPESLPATIEVGLPNAVDVDYAFIASHTLSSSGCAIVGEYYNGSSWVEMFPEYSPADDKVLAFLFDEVFSNRFRFSIDGSDIPSIAIGMMGKVLRMQRGVTLNHQPITLSRKTVVRPNVSEGGHTLGRTIRRKGVATQIVFEHLEADWVREFFDPFIESARVYPFGWVWHPVTYPQEAALLWTPAGKEDIRPAHDGLQNRMSVEFDVEGIVE